MANPMAPPGPTGGGTTDPALQRYLNGSATDADLQTLIRAGLITATQAAQYSRSDNQTTANPYSGLYPYDPSTGYIGKHPGDSPVGDSHFRGPVTTYIDPSTGVLYDASGKMLPQYLQRSLGGTGAGASYPPEYTDPRYWQLQYDQLQQQYVNSGLDAESARRQALATLIANRNAQSVNLLGEYGNIAKTIADYSANPRDAFAELNYRNMVGGATPFGAMSSNPQASQQYATALDQKGQALFGPLAAQLKNALGYLNQPIPTEYTSPAYTGPGSQFTSSAPQAQDQYAPYGGADLVGAFQKSGMSLPDFLKGINGGVAPPTAEGGTNMNIMEPAAVIGLKSGKIYSTMAEKDPEQLIVKPLPTTIARQKKQQQAQKGMQTMMKGVQMMSDGGTVNVNPSASDLITQLRQQLRGLGGSGGGTAGFDSGMPDVRLLAGAPYAALQNDPDLLNYTLAGYSRAPYGMSPNNVLSTIQKFTPNAPQNNFPRISF